MMHSSTRANKNTNNQNCHIREKNIMSYDGNNSSYITNSSCKATTIQYKNIFVLKCNGSTIFVSIGSHFQESFEFIQTDRNDNYTHPTSEIDSLRLTTPSPSDEPGRSGDPLTPVDSVLIKQNGQFPTSIQGSPVLINEENGTQRHRSSDYSITLFQT